MLGFLHVLEPMKRQDLLINRKWPPRIPTDAKIPFSEKKYFGVPLGLRGHCVMPIHYHLCLSERVRDVCRSIQ